MKKSLTYILLFTLALWNTGCSLETSPSSAIPTEKAFGSPQDVLNGMHGAYKSLGVSQFWGRNVVAIGDMSSDISLASTSSGHFVAINGWSINDDNAELRDTWTIGYQVIDRCTRAINGAKELIAHPADYKLSETDITNLHNYSAQLYSIRSLSHFTLANIFSLPFRSGTENSQLGIVLVDEKPIEAFEQVSRATVKQTYDQILKDIASAKEHFALLSSAYKISVSQYFMNEAALYALEARVKLYMQNYVGAAAAAERAIELRASADISNEDYVAMWSSVAINDEDIFTIVKSEDDNLSANSF